jgi:hypothetical protein
MMVAGPVLHAVAQEAYVAVGDEWKFYGEAFFERMLREAEHDGVS